MVVSPRTQPRLPLHAGLFVPSARESARRIGGQIGRQRLRRPAPNACLRDASDDQSVKHLLIFCGGSESGEGDSPARVCTRYLLSMLPIGSDRAASALCADAQAGSSG